MTYIDKDKIPYYLDTSEEAPMEGRKITFKSDIDKIPPADVVEVVHGEYIYSSTNDKWHCSECFAERPRNNGDIPYSDIYCCYKCGAKMDGGNK